MAAVSGISAPRTICMLGQIQGKDTRILVDSGSSHTFISSQLSDQLQGVLPLAASVHVQVAKADITMLSIVVYDRLVHGWLSVSK